MRRVRVACVEERAGCYRLVRLGDPKWPRGQGARLAVAWSLLALALFYAAGALILVSGGLR